VRYDNGVPREIGDLDPEPALNRPYSSDPGGRGGMLLLLEHIRAQAAFIAQLHARVKALEEIPAQQHTKS
jgi:hypothetical protein